MHTPSSPDGPPAKPAASLGVRAKRGVLVSVAGQGTTQLLRFASNLILSRLLFPQAFGVMAIVTLWLTALQMFSNVGIQPAIVRHARGDEPSFLDTAWTIQVARGVLLWLVGIATAQPLATFYGEPELALLVPVATFASVLMGFFSTKLVTQTRNLTLGRVVINEISGQIAALIASTAIAFAYRSVWALVVGGLVNATVRLVLSYVAIPGPGNRFRWNREAARDLLSFGRWIFVSTLFTFLAMRIDVVLLGKLLPMAMLGVYSIALQIPTMVRDVSGRVMQTVLMPALAASYRQGPQMLASSFARAQRLVLPCALLVVCAAGLLSPAFFGFLYDPRYREAGWIAQLSMIGLWFSFLHDSAGRALLAVGDSRAFAFANAVKTAATAGLCITGFAVADLQGLILGGALGAVCGYLVVALGLRRHDLPVLAQDLPYTLVGLVVALVVTFAPRVLHFVVGVEWVGLATVALGALVLLPLGIRTGRHFLLELRRA